MIRRQFSRLVLLSGLALVALLALASCAYAHFSDGDIWQLRQPDGTMIEVRIWGDEYYQVVETLDGYTLVRHPATCEIVYARLSDDGNRLVSSGVRVETANGADLGLEQHIRINPRMRQMLIAEARDRQEELGLEIMASKGFTPATLAPPSTGDVVGLCLIADFPDQVATIARSEVVNFCNQDGYNGYGNNGSVYNYFYDSSDGALRYTNWVMADYYRAPHNLTWYDNCTVPWLDRGVQLIAEILDSLDAEGFDFSAYDANSDGFIDAVNLFYAGSTTCGWAEGMWPGCGYMTWSNSAGTMQTLKFQVTGMGSDLAIATYCHENGHMVCLWPDLYDYGKDMAGPSYGVGLFCIMCHSTSGTNPEEPCAYLKYTASWLTPTVLTGFQTGLATPSGPNFCYKIDHPTLPNEYFMVENRQKIGRDVDLPDDGLAMWHIDENGNNSWNHMTPDSHFVVTLVQADGLWHMENYINAGDADDLYAAPTHTALTPCTNPNTNWWDGSVSDIVITDVSASSTNMTFTFSPSNLPPVAACRAYSDDADANCSIMVGVADIDNGSYDPDGPGDIDDLCITHVDGGYVGCVQSAQVTGAGSHTVTLRITDLCGDYDECTANVEVLNTAPVAVCMTHIAYADSDCCAIVGVDSIDGGSYDLDGVGDIVELCITAVNGSPVGCVDEVQLCGVATYAVTLRATDKCGAADECYATVNLIDITPPEISVELNRYVLWPPNHKMADIVATVTAEDNCDPDPQVLLVNVTSNEPDNNGGDGDTDGDIQGADLGTEDYDFLLRSERSGQRLGRVYTIVYSATDFSGNTAEATAYVRVPHNQPGVVMASTGFTVDGSGLRRAYDQFAVVIPSRTEVYGTDVNGATMLVEALFDATQLDLTRTYVGNTMGVLLPERSEALDQNGDGLMDLAVWYRIADVEPLADDIIQGQIGEMWISDPIDPVGIYYRSQSGVDYLVDDIFRLGEPVALGGSSSGLGDTGEVADATRLFPVQPNPFRASATIRFSLVREEHVVLRIYDARGVLVRTLKDRLMPPGQHQVIWDGRDAHGRYVAAGVYFTRFMAGTYTATEKTMFLR
jgi:M6 family metalloprotease-like protein